MQTVKKILVLAFFVASIALLSAEARAEKKIGILAFSGQTRYDDAVKGFIDVLKEAGFKGPETMFIIEQADANKARAAELVKTFAALKMDLIFTIGTSATVATAREIKTTPIVFAVVYDPVEAGIAKSWKSSGNNTTGTTTKFPVSKLLDTVQEFGTIKKLAVLYTPDEKNSESILRDMLNIQKNYTIKIQPVPLTKAEDIPEIMTAVVRTSDAIYFTGSNLVDSNISMIADMATKAGVVTMTHLEDLVRKGALLGICDDSYKGGRMAGEKAIRILKGAKPSSIPIESPGKYEMVLNMETLRAGRFQIPQKIMNKVTKKLK